MIESFRSTRGTQYHGARRIAVDAILMLLVMTIVVMLMSFYFSGLVCARAVFVLYLVVPLLLLLFVQDSLERLVRDAQMNGVRQIPHAPIKAEARPTPSPPKEEGKEEYPYR